MFIQITDFQLFRNEYELLVCLALHDDQLGENSPVHINLEATEGDDDQNYAWVFYHDGGNEFHDFHYFTVEKTEVWERIPEIVKAYHDSYPAFIASINEQLSVRLEIAQRIDTANLVYPHKKEYSNE